MGVVYVQTDEVGLPINVNVYLAHQGFTERGAEVRPVCDKPTDSPQVPFFDDIQLGQDDVLVGSISFVRKALTRIGIPIPEAIDYPTCLHPFLGRKVWSTSLGEIRGRYEGETGSEPIFIKPLGRGKVFTGHVVRRFRDLIETSQLPDEFEVLAVEAVAFAAEWRTFVLNGEILDVRLYKGDRFLAPSRERVEAIVKTFVESGEAPVAFAADIGLVQGETYLVEVNDSYSLGTYGLNAALYAQMIEARWRQLSNPT